MHRAVAVGHPNASTTPGPSPAGAYKNPRAGASRPPGPPGSALGGSFPNGIEWAPAAGQDLAPSRLAHIKIRARRGEPAPGCALGVPGASSLPLWLAGRVGVKSAGGLLSWARPGRTGWSRSGLGGSQCLGLVFKPLGLVGCLGGEWVCEEKPFSSSAGDVCLSAAPPAPVRAGQALQTRLGRVTKWWLLSTDRGGKTPRSSWQDFQV